MAELIPSWTPQDERQLIQLQERKERRARLLTKRVEDLADDIIIRNMSAEELAREMIDRASALTGALRPFLAGPFSAAVFQVGDCVCEGGKYSRMQLTEWTHRAIRNELQADGWVTEEFMENLTPNEMDGQGNRLHNFETLRLDANIATVRCDAEGGYLMIVRIPEGEEDF